MQGGRQGGMETVLLCHCPGDRSEAGLREHHRAGLVSADAERENWPREPIALHGSLCSTATARKEGRQ